MQPLNVAGQLQQWLGESLTVRKWSDAGSGVQHAYNQLRRKMGASFAFDEPAGQIDPEGRVLVNVSWKVRDHVVADELMGYPGKVTGDIVCVFTEAGGRTVLEIRADVAGRTADDKTNWNEVRTFQGRDRAAAAKQGFQWLQKILLSQVASSLDQLSQGPNAGLPAF